MASQDASVETLPSIIVSLAQQVAARDAQLKSERANFVEELAAMKDQHEVMRTARDHALHCVEEVTLQRDRLKDEVETVRVAWERKIEVLEQAAVHQAIILTQARHEAEDWQARYMTMVNEGRRHSEAWSLQFSRVGNRLEEIAAARTASYSGSSPTAVLSDTLSSKIITETVSPPKHTRIAMPSSKIESSSAPNTSIPTNNAPLKRSVHSQNGLTSPVTHRSAGSSIHQRPSQKRTRAPSQTKRESCSASRPSILSPQSALPPDRVIITAHYEMKSEEDGESSPDYCPLLDPSIYHASSSSGEGDEQGEYEEPAPKRRRTGQKRSARRVVDDDDKDFKHVVHMGDEDVQTQELGHESRGKDDFDEMAIGAEDNHEELYGRRRVDVPEINVRPQTPPYRAIITHSSGSSSKKRQAGRANGRATIIR